MRRLTADVQVLCFSAYMSPFAVLFGLWTVREGKARNPLQGFEPLTNVLRRVGGTTLLKVGKSWEQRCRASLWIRFLRSSRGILPGCRVVSARGCCRGATGVVCAPSSLFFRFLQSSGGILLGSGVVSASAEVEEEPLMSRALLPFCFPTNFAAPCDGSFFLPGRCSASIMYAVLMDRLFLCCLVTRVD